MQGYNPKAALGRWKAARTRATLKTAHWINHLVPALARAICREKGWDGFQFMGPSGLRCCVGISFLHNSKMVYTLQVCNPDLDTGTLSVTNYSQDNGQFPGGTIGALNGMQHPSFVIEPEWPVGKVLKYGSPSGEDDEVSDTDKVWKVG